MRFVPNLNLPIDRLTSEDLSVSKFDEIYGAEPWILDKVIPGVVKKLLDEGHYFALMMAGYRAVSAGTWHSHLLNNLGAFYSSPARGILYPYYLGSSNASLETIFSFVKMINCFAHFKVVSGVLRGKRYLTNLMYLAECDEAGIPTKVLATIMIKGDGIYDIRKRFIDNQSIPASMMELWVDNSLEVTGSQMKPHFRKYIKNKFENLGSPIKYFDDLHSEVTRYPGIEANTPEKVNEWKKEMLQEYVDHKKNLLKLVKEPPKGNMGTLQIHKVLKEALTV